MTELGYLVLYSLQPEIVRDFYVKLLKRPFSREKHGNGAEHWSCSLDNVVIEIYPTKKEASRNSLGFFVDDLETALQDIDPVYILISPKQTDYGRATIIKDPEKRRVELIEKKW
ncbi:hypothetical protein HYX13_05810 [Candidatus Woesearchaeota archaeon]|nr:hypothetical protein [Candidatus Woesearchaeota archaeon]